MMITLLTLGKLKGNFAYLQTGEAEYLKRLQPFAAVQLLELPDEAISATCPPPVALAREAERLTPYLQAAAISIALSETGQQFSSPQLAQQLAHWQQLAGENPTSSPPPGRKSSRTRGQTVPQGGILLVVGSAHGLAPSVLQHATAVWSLSKLTFPHPMVRLVVLEQLYRAFSIQRGLPYHK